MLVEKEKYEFANLSGDWSKDAMDYLRIKYYLQR